MTGLGSDSYSSGIVDVNLGSGERITLDERLCSLTFTSAVPSSSTLTLSCADIRALRELFHFIRTDDAWRIASGLLALGREMPPAQSERFAPFLAQAALRILRLFHFAAIGHGTGRTVGHRLGTALASDVREVASFVPGTLGDLIPGWLLEYGDRNRDLALGGLRAAAANLIASLPLHGLGYGWRVAFDESLGDSRRCEFLVSAYEQLAQENLEGYDLRSSGAGALEERREQRWWTAIVSHLAASAWYSRSAHRDPRAISAFRNASRQYLSVLRDDPHRSALAAYLRESGTTIEEETSRVLFARGVQGLRARHAPAEDEALRRLFLPWFLRRYNLSGGWRLMGRRRWTASAWIGAALLVSIVVLFGYGRHLPVPIGDLWTRQVVLQLFLVLMVAWPGRAILPLLLPRAFFGSLLAWTTIIVVTAAQMSASPVPETVHSFVSSFAVDQLPILLPLVFSFSIICHQMSAYIANPSVIARRAAIATVIAFAGSVFWGLAFVPFLQTVVEQGHTLADGHRPWVCAVNLLALGASLAVALGIVVQLVWQDESIAEPVSEAL